MLGIHENVISNPATLKQHHDAKDKIMSVFDYLERAVDSVDVTHPHSKEISNRDQLIPIANNFVPSVGQSAEHILSAYVDWLERGESYASLAKNAIEREAVRIFKQVRDVAESAKALDISNKPAKDAKALASQAEDISYMPSFYDDKRAYYNTLRTKRGPIQNMLFAEAQRLGKDGGAQFLSEAENVLLATVDMLRAIKTAGLNVDLNVLPGKEARFEYAGFVPPEEHTAHLAASHTSHVLPPVEPLKDPNRGMGKNRNN